MPLTRAIGHTVSVGIVFSQIVSTHYAIEQVEAKVKMIGSVLGRFKKLDLDYAQFDVSTNNLVAVDLDTIEKDIGDFPSGGIPFGGGEKIHVFLEVNLVTEFRDVSRRRGLIKRIRQFKP